MGCLSRDSTVGSNGFHNLVADFEHRVQRRLGFLEHESDFATADASHLAGTKLREIATAPSDGAAGHLADATGEKSEHRQSGEAFSATGFSDEADGLTLLDSQRYVVDGVNVAIG